MHTAVTVTVHDHVHLAGTGHAVVGVCSVDAEGRPLPNSGALASGRRFFRIRHGVKRSLPFSVFLDLSLCLFDFGMLIRFVDKLRNLDNFGK